jgi:hypothetical protein
MTTQNFLLALGVGSALIAFWLVLRFPDRGPGDLQRALLHVIVALTVGWVAPGLIGPLVSRGLAAAVAAVFVLIFPVLVYTFVAGAWVLKIAHERISQYR